MNKEDEDFLYKETIFLQWVHKRETDLHLSLMADLLKQIIQEHENNMICCPEDCYCWDARDLISSYEEWLNE